MRKKNIIWLVVGLGIIMFILFLSLNKEDSNFSNNSYDAKRDIIKINPSESVNKNSLYKSLNRFSGEEYCIFVFDEKNIPYIVNKTAYLNFCNLSDRYPHIEDFLYNQYYVTIEKGDDWMFAAWYTGRGNIVINDQFKQAKNLDLYLAHEVAHSATETLNLPTWFDEGVAEYSAYRFFKTQYKLNSFWFEGFEYWNPNKGNYGENIKGYQHAGFVVKKLIETYGEDSFKNILLELDGKVGYSDPDSIKNKKVLEAIKKVVQNDSIELKDIIKPLS